MARNRRSGKTNGGFLPLLGLLLFAGFIGNLFTARHEPAPPSLASSPVASNNPVSSEKQSVPSPATPDAATPDIPGLDVGQPSTVAASPQAADVRRSTSENGEARFIRGRKVALRDGPGKQFGILDRYDTGRAVILIEVSGDWAHIRDKLTQRDGWVSAKLLSEQEPMQDTKAEEARTTAKPPAPAKPVLPAGVLIQRIIAESIASYPGSCACPYNTDRAGRKCGRRSAYNRGGGYAPLCFAGDVSKEALSEYQNAAAR